MHNFEFILGKGYPHLHTKKNETKTHNKHLVTQPIWSIDSFTYECENFESYVLKASTRRWILTSVKECCNKKPQSIAKDKAFALQGKQFALLALAFSLRGVSSRDHCDKWVCGLKVVASGERIEREGVVVVRCKIAQDILTVFNKLFIKFFHKWMANWNEFFFNGFSVNSKLFWIVF